jgi:peptidylprolyl isomerase
MAKDGNTVKVHYTGTLGDGTVFDTSVEREPLEFTLGEGKVIPGFEEAVKGMKVGQSKTVTIPVDDAYGPRRDDLILEIERTQLPENLNPEVGQRLHMEQANGRQSIVTVTDVSQKTITLDANHPLAGADLTFELKLVEVK